MTNPVIKESISILNIHSIKVCGDEAYLTIIVPESLLSTFQEFLRSAVTISGYIKNQIRFEQTIQKAWDLVYQEELRKEYEKFSQAVLAHYDRFIYEGFSVRAAIRKTKEFYHKKGNDTLTCYTIELIVRESGRLWKRKKKKNQGVKR